MLLVQETVVRGEDEERVGEPTGVSEHLDDPPDELVDGEQRLPLVPRPRPRHARGQDRPVSDVGGLVRHVGLVDRRAEVDRRVPERPVMARRRDERAVGRVRGGHQEQRRVCRRVVHERRRQTTDHVRRVVPWRRTVLHDPVGVVEHPVVVVAAVLLRERGPAIPARWDVDVVAEVAVEVLPDQSGPVAGGVERRRDRVRLRRLERPPPPSGPTLEYTPVVCEYRPVRIVAREGQHSALVTIARRSVIPSSASSWTLGITWSVSNR